MTSRPSNPTRAFVLTLGMVSGCCTADHATSNYPLNAGCDRCSPGTPSTARLAPAPASPTPATVPMQPGADSGVRLSPPETLATEPPRDLSRQAPPNAAEPPIATVPPKPREDTPATPALPDIPQFAIAKKGVAAGQQPLGDGVTWLKERGYRTVLHIRPPEDTSTAAEKIVERRGLKYVSLHLSATTLSREVVEQFNRLVTDAANQPLFVFDRDGSLAGGLWYLHFRLVDRLPDDQARAEAARLGFREDGAHRSMWIAVQKYLSDNNP